MPVQVTPLALKDASTVNVAVIGSPEVFVAVNAGILPVPVLATKPISGVGTVRLQLNTAPGTGLLKTVSGTEAPVQYT